MRKLLVFSIIFFNMLSCNNDGNKKNEPQKENVKFDFNFLSPFLSDSTISSDTTKRYSALANIIIPTDKSKIMIAQYRSLFETHPNGSGQKITALKDSIWIDKSSVIELEKLLIDNKQYSGYRIYHTSNPAESEATSPEPFKPKTNITFLPTIKVNDVNTLDKKFTKPGSYKTPYLKSYTDAEPLLQNFESVYSSNLSNIGNKKVQSQGVMFDREVILIMAKILKNDELLTPPLKRNLNGINVLSASYIGNEALGDTPAGMVNPPSRQSTFIMVHSREVGGRVENDWEILDMIYMYLKSKWYGVLGGYNHGELCPQICN
jgi:hypothetical protein